MAYVFADCELDCERRELRRNGTAIHLEPQVFDVLVHLVRNRDRVVTKDELLQAVWNGRVVSEDALTSRISAARRAIGDTGEDQQLIRTVPRRGFRFVGARPRAVDRWWDRAAAYSPSPGSYRKRLRSRPLVSCERPTACTWRWHRPAVDRPWSRPPIGSIISSSIGKVRCGRRCFSGWSGNAG